MSNSADIQTVETYRFIPGDLNVSRRTPGVSAFMRIKNGADFLEATIRSHIPHVDEIVAVFNQCTDATPEILARLAAEFPGKLRAIRYAPAVFPPGSDGHAAEPADSPRSFVNQSNFALAQTRHQVVMKLDDDHIAMADRFGPLAGRVRRAGASLRDCVCFSGINIARDERGATGVLATDPFAGAGDHFFFRVTPETRFIHDPRFEDFAHGGRRVFGDITYWHVKHLKDGYGFANRDIDTGGNPRFQRKRDAFLADRRVVSLAALRAEAPFWTSIIPTGLLPEKARLRAERWRRFVAAPPSEDELAAVAQSSLRPSWRA